MRAFFIILATSLTLTLGACQTPDHHPPQTLASRPALASTTHSAKPPRTCPLCLKPIPSGKEVWLTTGDAQPVAYRCVHCALTVQAASAESSLVVAHSPISDCRVTIRRTAGGWYVQPQTAVFLSVPEEGGECMDRHKVFLDRQEFQLYLEQHPKLPRAKSIPYTIHELAAILARGLPSNGIRPAAPVQLLVVGMLNHLPFKQEVLPAIQGALSDAGPKAGAHFVDALAPQGKAILQAHGIHQHLPVIMFLNGQSRFLLGKQAVDLRGFPGGSWTRPKLALVLERAINESTNTPPL